MTGQRFDFQGYTQGQRGGLSLYPFCGIINGLVVSNVAIAGAGNDTLTMNVSLGAARLDGQYTTLASNITALTLAPGVGALNTGTHNVEVWLVPTRVVPAQAAAPSGPVAGKKYIKTIDMGEYLLVDDIKEYDGSAWLSYDAISGPPADPNSHNNLPMNEVGSTISTATSSNPNLVMAPEKAVYHKSNMPIGLSVQGPAYLRQPAGVRLAVIDIVGGAITLQTYGDDARLSV